MSRKKKLTDPYAKREAGKYAHPIASRELILEVLEKSAGPTSLSALHRTLDVRSDKAVDALARRLAAMERDGQIIRNRQNHYLPVTKVDLVRGRVMGHPDGFGFLIPDEPDESGADLFLSPFEMRTLMHGDRAVVRPAGLSKRGKPQAKLVEIIERHNKQIVGRYYKESGIGFVVPDNRRLHQDVMIPAHHINGAANGQFVVAAIIEQPNRHRQPIGKIIEVLGDHLAPGMEIDVAVRSYDLPHTWPDEVLREIRELDEEDIRLQLVRRKDLRALPFVTIDGEDAKDFDDAVVCEPRTHGWRLWVAIADVAHYVRSGSALDLEARKRGTSVYFPERVIPMFPERLSNDLCSLKPKVDRLAIVCEMLISPTGELRRATFYEAVIHSIARLTYNEVQHRLDSGAAPAHLAHLQGVYRALNKRRKKREAVDFEMQETVFRFDRNGKIEAILPSQRHQSHKIIEECMICANVAAAKFITRQKLPTLFRVHDAPTEDKLKKVREFLQLLGIAFTATKPQSGDYVAVMKNISARKDKAIIEKVLLRSMAQATYTPKNVGHFGLALPLYTHFTSPIRRYPDLIVHRTIRHLLAKESRHLFPLSKNDLLILGEECSMCERRADDATRDVDTWLKCEYMLDKVGQKFSGVISQVASFGFFVTLNDLLIEGLVHVTALSNDYYHYDEASQRLFGERSNRSYRLGDAVKVVVAAVNLDDRKIDFVLAAPSGGANKSARRKRRRR